MIQNLQSAFPQKTESEITEFVKDTYRNLSDILLESIKGLSMSENALAKRFILRNPEFLSGIDPENDLMLLTGHFNNWEWGIHVFHSLIERVAVGIYKPIKNKYINDFLKQKRSRYGILLYPMKETRLAFKSNTRKSSVFYLAADQSPSNLKRSVWLDFLNQKTPCIHGPEKYAKAYGMPVIYAHIIREKRGKYSINLEWISKTPSVEEENFITTKYNRILEKDIIANPGSWLWTHRRWKHKSKFQEYSG